MGLSEMFRILFHLFAPISLMLMVFFCWLGAYSYEKEIGYRYLSPYHGIYAFFVKGEFVFIDVEHHVKHSPQNPLDRTGFYSREMTGSDPRWVMGSATTLVQLGVVEYYGLLPGESGHYKAISSVFVSIWFVSFLFSILPILWLIAMLRHFHRFHRVHNGLCVKCAYNLRGSKDKCPECGAARVLKA